MQEHKSHLTLEELAEQVDIPVRTIRYYISEGLLPGPEGRGKATTYGEEHLQRLYLIRLLSHQHMPLAEIYTLLNRLSLAEVQTVLAEEEQRTKELEPASQQPPPQEYIATLLKHAQAVRQASGPLPLPAPLHPPTPPPMRKDYEEAGGYDVTRVSSGERWRRWELAPGVELHVREGAEEEELDLLERLCKVAGITLQRPQK